MKKIAKYSVYLLSLVMASCSGESDSESKSTSGEEKGKGTESVSVTTMLLRPMAFAYDLVSNGKAGAGDYVDVRFTSTDVVIDRIMVSNPVLESELALIQVGDAVEVKPFSSERTSSGKVSSINPVVDKNGMVNVCAKVSGDTGGLYDGMNVRINVKRDIERALVVPKSAVVLRNNGRQVVFPYRDGKAIWNYVYTGIENMDEFVITDGLTEGQEVIVGGNLSLAHESPVKVISD